MKRDAEFNTLTFDMFPPETAGEEPKLVHLERDHQERLCQGVKHPKPHRVLKQIVEIAEYGPCYPFRTGTAGKSCRPRAPIRVEGERRSERIAQRRARDSMVDNRLGI